MSESDALQAVQQYRELVNQGRVAEVNALVTDDFFAVFSLGNPGEEYETYTADQYRSGNEEAKAYYQGKYPRWHYTDLASAMRGESEFVITAKIEFTLNGDPVMNALVMEVYRLDGGAWKLARQYMEKHRPYQERL